MGGHAKLLFIPTRSEIVAHLRHLRLGLYRASDSGKFGGKFGPAARQNAQLLVHLIVQNFLID